MTAAWERRLRAEGDPERAAGSRRFFRTGSGQYGEGDRFFGIPVPRLRALAREARELSPAELEALLASPWHEARLFALIVLTERAKRLKARAADRLALAEWAFERRTALNNWDLVDVSVPDIFGGFVPGPAWRKKVASLLGSPRLWDRRMAMLATLGWMRLGDLDPCFVFAERLLGDREDLLHKAAGWMLREAGKRDLGRLRAFLDAHAAVMPRTMLRYAIERLPEGERRAYRLRRASGLK